MYTLRYLATLLRFSFVRHPLLYVCLLVSAVSVVIELVAMSSLLPLSALMMGQAVPEHDRLVRFLRWLNLVPDAQTLLLSFTLILGLRIATQFGSRSFALRTWRQIHMNFCTEAFANVICFCSLREVEQKSIGYYVGLTGDEAARASNIVHQVVELSGVLLLATLYYTAICVYSWSTGMAVLCFLATTGLLSLRLLYTTRRLGAQAMEQSRAANSLIIDTLNGIRSVKAFAAGHYVAETNRANIARYLRLLWRIDVLNAGIRFGPVLLLLAGFGAYVALGVGKHAADADWATLLTVVVFVLRLFPLLGTCVNAGLRILADVQAGKDVTDMMQHQSSKPAGRGKLLGGPVRTIVLEHVAFAYDPAKPIVRQFGAAFTAGKSYAIMGPSGAGKSTLVNLILKFYSPDRGTIYVNGMALDEIDEAEFRQRVILLEQQTAIFSDTLRSNIAFGRDTSDETIAWAARVACIDTFIVSLPAGYQTVAHYQGNNLSGGQRQRIGLARALVRRPDVLILDEGTSALDKATRELVVQNLLTEFKDRILIFVTHDIELARRVDCVVYVDPASPVAVLRECG